MYLFYMIALGVTSFVNCSSDAGTLQNGVQINQCSSQVLDGGGSLFGTVLRRVNILTLHNLATYLTTTAVDVFLNLPQDV